MRNCSEVSCNVLAVQLQLLHLGRSGMAAAAAPAQRFHYAIHNTALVADLDDASERPCYRLLRPVHQEAVRHTNYDRTADGHAGPSCHTD